jgi:large subunit ribosomal protein L5
MTVTPAPRYVELYRETVVPALITEFGYLNVMQVPRLDKIIVNVGVGEASQNGKALDAASGDLRIITGQQPSVRKAKKSVAAFKLREGMPVGLKVTLRGVRMLEFLDRLISVALPRIRDFRGIAAKFDGHGNLTLGLREQLVFPEIDYDKIDKLRGFEITIVTTADTDAEGRSLLAALGMPFRRREG